MRRQQGSSGERGNESQETLEELAARIRVSGAGQTLPRPSQEAIDRFAAEVDNGTPLTPEQEAEWNKQWAAVEADIRRIDEEDEAADRERDLDQNLKMLAPYMEEAMRHARYKTLDDGAYVGEIPGIDGVWASTATLEACRDELEDVLQEWVAFSLVKGLLIPDIDTGNRAVRPVQAARVP